MIPARTIILVPAASQAAAIAQATLVDQPTLTMFPLAPASGSASAAATFWGAAGPLHWSPDVEPKNAAKLVAATPGFPGCFFWRGTPIDPQTVAVTSDYTGTMANGFTDGQHVGQPLTLAQMLIEAGLQRQAIPVAQ